ncbi:hypothetical protein J132_09368 [Termitomyces sp. J132]|nr:hypothetical protein J132_09368 [Termitomyces sp. J132]
MISDLRAPKFVVGIGVEWDWENCLVKLLQTTLIDKIILQFGQSHAMPLSLPMEPGLKLRRLDKASILPDEATVLQKTPYRSLVRCLFYIAISTHLNITYAVQQLTQYVNCYTSIHWNTKHNIADLFTKALAAPLFTQLHALLGLQ